MKSTLQGASFCKKQNQATYASYIESFDIFMKFQIAGDSKDAAAEATSQTAALAKLRIGSDVDMDEEVLLLTDRRPEWQGPRTS